MRLTPQPTPIGYALLNSGTDQDGHKLSRVVSSYHDWSPDGSQFTIAQRPLFNTVKVLGNKTGPIQSIFQLIRPRKSKFLLVLYVFMNHLSRRGVLIGVGTCCISLFSGCTDILDDGLSEDEERTLQHYQDGFERNELGREYFDDAVEKFEMGDYDSALSDFRDASDLFSASSSEFDEIVPFYADQLNNQEIGEIASEASEASGNGSNSAGSMADSLSSYQTDRIDEENLIELYQSHVGERGDEAFITPPVSEFKNAL